MEQNNKLLPENAFRQLNPGEKYIPIIPADQNPPELSTYSVSIGVLMAVLFSAAATYITLKLGQGIETAIPIAILAIGIASIKKRKVAIIENVNILAWGATSGIVAGGSLFIMPAIFILGLERQSSFFQIFFVPLLGAILGVLFLIPFRRYFVADMHGKLPFPEATATTEILVAGQEGGKKAKLLVFAMLIGGIYDFLLIGMNIFKENFSTASISSLNYLTTKIKAIFSLNTTAAIAGLGYLIGVRYAAIILGGSFLSYFIIVPIFAYLGQFINNPIPPGDIPILQMDAEAIFSNYARFIGIGGIFAAGVISVLKLSPVIIQAIMKAVVELRTLKSQFSSQEKRERTDQDVKMALVIGMFFVLAVVLWIYFRFSVLPTQENPTGLSTLGLILIIIISFLFTSVSAWAIAMISVTPISGMTLMTLIVTAVIFAKLGLHGNDGMLATLLIGGVVCTALSMSGTLITEFKISYWTGATPTKIQWSNILGCIAAAVTVTAVMYLLNTVYGFHRDAIHPNALPAPQANAMSEVIRSMMSEGGYVPWFLYGLGAAIAIIVEMLGVSGLAFALGMYIPIEYNSPIIVGAIVAYLVKKSSQDKDKQEKRYERGILFSSGLIAGGAIMGVISAIIMWIEGLMGKKILPDFDNNGAFGNWLGLFAFLALCALIYLVSVRDGEEKAKENK